MKPSFISILKQAGISWSDISSFFYKRNIPAHTTLLYEGDIARNIYFISKGALRLWNNDDGRDITFQFFFENQIVSSFESFYLEEESIFSIESLEETALYVLSKKNLNLLLEKYPVVNDLFTRAIAERFMDYSKYFLSRIKETPEERYSSLVQQNSIILNRVPNYYIASYLGITPVSYSRIKKRLEKNGRN